MELLVIVGLSGLLLLVGALVALAVVRHRPAGPRAERDAASAVGPGVIDSVIALAADQLDHRLAAGQEQLDRQGQRLVEQLGALQERVTRHVDLRDQAMGQHLELRDSGVTNQVADMRTSLDQVTRLVTELQRDRAAQHREVVTRLEETAKSQRVLTQVTTGLREALASPKARGSWGERTAEDLLRRAGLVEGMSYVRQRPLPCGTVPDVTFLMPQSRSLHMDVKFPVDNYLRHLESTSEIEAERYRKAFLADVRNRIRELTTRSYTDVDTTVGYMLLFIPNESVYSFVMEHEPNLLDQALSQRVVMCSPFTLYAVVAVVRQATELVQLERRTDDVLRTLEEFTVQWSKFSEQLDKVERHTNALVNSVHDLNGPRRRQLERQLGRLDDLRALSDGDAPDGAPPVEALVSGGTGVRPSLVPPLS